MATSTITKSLAKDVNTLLNNFKFEYGHSYDANTLFDNGMYRSVNGIISNCPANDGYLIVIGQPEFNSKVQIFIDTVGVFYKRIAWGASSTSFTSSWQQL